MPRPSLGDQPMSGAEKAARRRSLADAHGGKTVTLHLGSASVEAIAAIRAANDLPSDRAAIEAALAKMAKSIKRKPAVPEPA